MFADCDPIGLLLALTFVLGLRQGSQFLIPIGFQCIGNEAIGGINVHVSPLRQFGFIAGAFDPLLSQPVGFIEPRLQLLLNRQRDLQRQRRHGLHQDLAYGLVDMLPRDALTNRSTLLDCFSLADVIRDAAPTPVVIPNAHPASTHATKNDALQQCRPLVWRAAPAIGAESLRVLPEPALVAFVLVPGDIAGVHAGNQHPLFSGKLRPAVAAIRLFACPRAAVDEGARISGLGSADVESVLSSHHDPPQPETLYAHHHEYSIGQKLFHLAG